MSMASGGAFTPAIFARIAATAPVISSTVSPRTLSAIRNPPICDGVTSPESIEFEGAFRLGPGQRRASGDFGDQRLERFHELVSRCPQ